MLVVQPVFGMKSIVKGGSIFQAECNLVKIVHDRLEHELFLDFNKRFEALVGYHSSIVGGQRMRLCRPQKIYHAIQVLSLFEKDLLGCICRNKPLWSLASFRSVVSGSG